MLALDLHNSYIEHYFEMSRPDSERALRIYKTFALQTDDVVKFLGVARHFEAATRLEIPKLKHASTDLARLLEDDLNDPDFDLRRREYLAEKEAKRRGGRSFAPSSNSGTNSKPSLSSKPMPSIPKAEKAPQPEPSRQREPSADLIDFFGPIEPNPQTLAQHQASLSMAPTGIQPQQPFYSQTQPFNFQQPHQVGQSNMFGASFTTPQQDNNPFGQPHIAQPLQQTPTGAGFGGYSAQPQVSQPLQQTPTGAGFGGYSPQPQAYGFRTGLEPIPQNGVATFGHQQQQTVQQQPMQHTALQPQATNPFRQSMLGQSGQSGGFGGTAVPSSGLSRQDTNPFARHRVSSNPQFGLAGSPSQAFTPTTSSQPSPAFQTQAPLQIQRTGTNPFAHSVAPSQPHNLQPLRPNPTGSTNPFRQSAFINQQTGQGWQVGPQQTSMGGLEHLDTVPIFPRPGMA